MEEQEFKLKDYLLQTIFYIVICGLLIFSMNCQKREAFRTGFHTGVEKTIDTIKVIVKDDKNRINTLSAIQAVGTNKDTVYFKINKHTMYEHIND